MHIYFCSEKHAFWKLRMIDIVVYNHEQRTLNCLLTLLKLKQLFCKNNDTNKDYRICFLRFYCTGQLL